MSNWEKRASEAYRTYNVFIDWEERFFICPECEEPIYECDYDYELRKDFCPICETKLFDFEIKNL